ncbi:protein kinase [Streptomyces sp. SID5785]|uniref:serine/threonine-protein kinase n=1 Tax=Streptomyces sp. SID5785 TaxID=2690309 RepID=UPI0013611620|nr:serine/threonine-protein kinase [Streptomyces sp. SID5785]MZD08553.1 protein kinase [Streptomyces sp. SID5785]
MQGELLAGRYRLGESIGRGGMGRVWRAHDEVLHRVVAVKELTAAQFVSEADRAVLLTRTQTEARAAARINHPAVVTVHDVLEHDERPWIVMELVEGPSLADAVKEHGRIVPAEAARIGLWTLRALRAAHAAGVLHRDVKPGNVLLSLDGRVKLTDFGIAQVEGDTTITRTGEIVGSVDYLAPERVSGAEPGPAADLWALGATLYTAVEGRSPFRRTSPLSTMQAVIEEEPEVPEHAGAIGPVIGALLRKDPAARPGADEAEAMLAEAAEGRRPTAAQAFVPTQVHRDPPPAVQGATSALDAPPSASYPQTPLPQPPARPRRWPRVLAFALAAVLVAGGGAYGGLYYVQHRGTTASGGSGGTDGGDGGTSPDASASTTPVSGAIPKDWKPVHDVEGFSLMLPPGWERQMDGTQIDYTPDGGERFLRIAVDKASQWPDSYQHQLDLEKQMTKLPDYQRVRLQSNKFRDNEGSLWEFTWTAGNKDTTSGPRHAIEQTYVAGDGTEYALYLSVPEDDWGDARSQFDAILRGWQPPA